MELSHRYNEALAFAFSIHANQSRKGSTIPYFTHVAAVSTIVLEYGGDEDTAIAALLHDAAEDQGGQQMVEKIRQEFGNKVALIVEQCSDTFESPKPPWRERKESHIAHLSTISPEARLVVAADKLHNLTSIIRDHRLIGEDIWNRFKGGKTGTLWYYQSMISNLKNLSNHPIHQELDYLLEQIFHLTSRNP